MPMLPARHYQSEITDFINDLKASKPHLETEQKKSRAIWWDKTPAQLEQRREFDQGWVKQKAYVYGSGK
jgi:hypothetical protein